MPEMSSSTPPRPSKEAAGKEPQYPGRVPVFISFASSDITAAADLATALEDVGVSTWYAPRDIPVGGEYAREIVRAISGSRALIVLLSDEANASKFVAREVETADRAEVPIVAYRLEDVTPGPSLALFLNNIQWIDAFRIGRDDSIARVAARLAEMVGGRKEQPAKPPRVEGSGTRLRRIVVAVLGLLVPILGVGAWYWHSLAGSARSRDPKEAVVAIADALGTIGVDELTSRYAAPGLFQQVKRADVAASLVPLSSALGARRGPARLLVAKEIPPRALNVQAPATFLGWSEIQLPGGQAICLLVTLLEDPDSRTWGFNILQGFPVASAGCTTDDDLREAEAAAAEFLDAAKQRDPAPELLTAQLAAQPADRLAEYWKTYRSTLELASPPRLLATLPAVTIPGLMAPGRHAVVRYALDNDVSRQNLDLWLTRGDDGRWQLALVPALLPAVVP